MRACANSAGVNRPNQYRESIVIHHILESGKASYFPDDPIMDPRDTQEQKLRDDMRANQ